MTFVHQQGIFDAQSDPQADGDVIMAAAIVGHAYTRLAKKLPCSFEVEPDFAAGNPLQAQGYRDLTAVVGAINLALQNAGGDFGQPKGRKVVAGLTPAWDAKGNVRIIGGTGNMSTDNALRYDPPAPATQAARKLLALALGHPTWIGYQGKGAYTGFVDGRDGGQSNLFCTYRHVIPDVPKTRRWIPSKPVDGVAVGMGDGDKIWGMISTRKFQEKLREQGMYFQDADTARGHGLPGHEPDANSLMGYTHGMIQAIYDVMMHRVAAPQQAAGTPYEIAIGQAPDAKDGTTKLASCICCAVFMEATGFPASCTHLGHADCWAPLYPENPAGSAPDMSTAQNKARAGANDAWATYCAAIVKAGLPLIEKNLVGAAHQASFAKLKAYASTCQPVDCANLILDAATLCQSETERLARTLRPAA